MSILLNIGSDFKDFQSLINLYEEHKDELFSDIRIEIQHFFAANMSAALGAVLDKFIFNHNNIYFDYLDHQVEEILLKNDFLTYFGKQRAADVNNTTIKYQKLKLTDGKYFKNYVIKELIEGRIIDLPKMSRGIKEKIIEAIYEIFVNAQIHSKTEFIYTCGQFFPKSKKIEFTITDTGIGFREKINKRFKSKLSAIQAIKWAVEEMSTTKKEISGGLGLAILREFILANKGKMQIVSNDGFYQVDSKKEIFETFQGEFPGTIVNLQFRTDDNNNYSFKSEIDVNDIF